MPSIATIAAITVNTAEEDKATSILVRSNVISELTASPFNFCDILFSSVAYLADSFHFA